jgi:hypothetical protein
MSARYDPEGPVPSRRPMVSFIDSRDLMSARGNALLQLFGPIQSDLDLAAAW